MANAATEQLTIVDEIEDTVKQAAGKATVTMIRIEIGKGLSISKVQIAKELQLRFPQASIELEESNVAESVVVKDIEVE